MSTLKRLNKFEFCTGAACNEFQLRDTLHAYAYENVFLKRSQFIHILWFSAQIFVYESEYSNGSSSSSSLVTGDDGREHFRSSPHDMCRVWYTRCPIEYDGLFRRIMSLSHRVYSVTHATSTSYNEGTTSRGWCVLLQYFQVIVDENRKPLMPRLLLYSGGGGGGGVSCASKKEKKKKKRFCIIL